MQSFASAAQRVDGRAIGRIVRHGERGHQCPTERWRARNDQVLGCPAVEYSERGGGKEKVRGVPCYREC